MTIATWIIAFSTVVYTIGTFLLWWTTRQAIMQSEKAGRLADDAFKLNVLITLIGLHRPTWGTDNSVFDADKKAYDDIRRATSSTFKKMINDSFPLDADNILKIFDERYGK